MCEYGFAEGVDFNPLSFERVATEGGREVKREIIDHAIKVDMAKEIAMLQRTEKGKQARQYFIAIEKQYKNETSQLNGDLLVQKALQYQQTKIQKQLEKITELVQKVEVLEPKAQFADAISNADTCIDIGTLAVELAQNGLCVDGSKIGRNRLFHVLVSDGFLFRVGSEYRPHQRFMESGLFRLVSKIVDKDNYKSEYHQVLVTPKGRNYFLKKYIFDVRKSNAIFPEI
jgi:anti-repressor protein